MHIYRLILSLLLIFNLVALNIPYVRASVSIFAFQGKNETTNSSYSTTINAKPGDKVTFSLLERSFQNHANLDAVFTYSDNNFTYTNVGSSLNYYTIKPVPQSGTETNNNLFNPPLDNTIRLATSSLANTEYNIMDTDYILSSDIHSDTWRITGQFVADNGATVSSVLTNTVRIDHKPHVVGISLSPTSIFNNGTSSTDLTIMVKDLNGCTDIDQATIAVDLSSLGGAYTNNELLTYVSCDSATKTAIYQKSGIVTLASPGAKTVNITNIRDDSGFSQDITGIFAMANEVSLQTVDLIVALDTSPIIHSVTVNNPIVGGNTQAGATIIANTTLNWDGDWNGNTNDVPTPRQYKIALDSDASCNGGTDIVAWIDQASEDGSRVINANELAVGNNKIYICLKNADGVIGSGFVNVVRDDNYPIIANAYTISPSNIIQGGVDVNFTFQCNETGSYEMQKGGTGNKDGNVINSGAYDNANQNITVTIPNATFTTANTMLYAYCIDPVGYYAYQSGNVVRTATPNTAVQNISLVDNDNLYNSIDGRDFTISWDEWSQAGFDINDFSSYRVFILPSAVANVDINLHQPIYSVGPSTVTTITLPQNIIADSAGNNFVAGTYKAYLRVDARSGASGPIASSNQQNIIADSVAQPSLQNAQFISDTELELEYDIDLSTNINDHDASRILSTGFAINPNCNGHTNGVKTVNGKFMTVCINSLLAQEGSLALSLAKTVPVIGQIDSLIPSNVETGDTFNFTVAGSVNTASFVATDSTVSNVITGLTNAINASNFTDVVAGGVVATNKGTYIEVKSSTFNTAFTSFTSTIDKLNGNNNQNLLLLLNMENAIRSANGGYNCHLSKEVNPILTNCSACSNIAYSDQATCEANSAIWNIYADTGKNIKDKQTPNPTSIGNIILNTFTYNTDVINTATNGFNGFFNGNITVNYTVPETLSASTRLKIEAVGGANDSNSPYNLILTGNLAVGNHQIILNPIDLNNDANNTLTDQLKSGTYYRLSIMAVDLANNIAWSNQKTGLKYDNYSPYKIISVPYPNAVNEGDNATANRQPTLTWFSGSDDASGLHSTQTYIIDICKNANFSPCNSADEVQSAISTVAQYTPTIQLSDGDYYWRVSAKDAMNNFNFCFNASVSSQATCLNATPKAKWDSSKNKCILNYLIDQNTCEASTDCGGACTWNTLWSEASAGVPRNFTVNTAVATITGIQVDVNGGTVNTNFIRQNSTITVKADITQTKADATCVRLDINTIKTGASTLVPTSFTYNAGNSTLSATWSAQALNAVIAEGIKNIIVRAGNADCNLEQTLNKTITVDNTAPQVSANTIISPSAVNTYLKGSTSNPLVLNTYNIQWSPASITETNLEKVSLEYASDGTNFTTIAGAEALFNNGSFTWIVPTDTNLATAKIKLIATDKTGQTGNDLSDNSFSIDSISPSTPNLTYPNGGEILKGNQLAVLTWDNVSALDTNILDNPIDLEYSINGGTNWIAINDPASKIAKNTTTYNWTTPNNVNTGNAMIKLVIWDKAGNAKADISTVFVIDSIAPVLEDIIIKDFNANGFIDAISLEFNESMKSNIISTANFTVAGHTINASGIWSTKDIANDIFTFTINETADNTGIKPDVIYTADASDDFTDIAGNNLPNILTNFVEKDGAKPVVLARKSLDTNTDGTLDGVELTFSENMDASQVNNTSFQLKTAGNAELDEFYDDTVDDNTLLLKFTDGLDFNTADLTQSKIVNTNFKDLAGNSTLLDSNFVSAIDQAVPVFKAETWIANITPAIKITFSEVVNSPSDDFSDWTISDGFTVTAMDSLDGLSTAHTILSLNQNFINTGLTPTVTYTAGDILDTNANIMPTSNKVATDLLAPSLQNVNLQDNNFDGKIETVEVVFSENMQDDSLVLSGFTIGGVEANNFSTIAGVDTDANDDRVTLSLNEGISGTDNISAKLVYSAITGQLKDLNNNALPDRANNDLPAETDQAGPVIISASYIEDTTDQLILFFSEAIDDSLSLNDLVISGGGDLSGALISTGIANDQIITVTNITNALVVGTSTVNINGNNKIEDLNSNFNGSTNAVTVRGAVIINEVSYGSLNYLELKNLSANSISVNNWSIINAKANNGTLVLPNTSIAGNGYLLLVNTAITNINIDDNLTNVIVEADFSLSATNNGNLALKDNNNVIMDEVEATTSWPAGEANNNYAMERTSPAGYGLDANNWYTAVDHINFDGLGTERGTPGANNVFDNIAPVIDLNTRTPAVNSLTPITMPIISIEYADNNGGVGIDTANTKIFLDTDDNYTNGINGCDEEKIATVTTTNLTYAPDNNLRFGKNRACVQVKDLADNISTTVWDFWIDKLTMTVSELSPVNLAVQSGLATETADEMSLITITTYGANLDVEAVFPALSGNGVNFAKEDFFHDTKLVRQISDTGSWVEQHTYNSYLDGNNSLVEHIEASDLVAMPEIKTYKIYLKYKLNAPNTQAAGNYAGQINFNLAVQY